MAANSGAWKTVIEEVFSSRKDSVQEISRFLWQNPEPSFSETQAHKCLTDFLEKEGFVVEKNFVAPTGFRAVYDSSGGAAEDTGAGDASVRRRPNICFVCEYDATAEVGHAAGHNLKSQASVAAALAIKACLKKNLFDAKLTILGTPGEDCGCGTKISMMRQGIFQNIDLCMMLSPFNKHILYPKFYTLLVVTVNYRGKAAHASAFPWEGRNALDAAVACYNNVGLLRQQMKPTWSINGIILTGGVQPNVIPEFTELKFWLRAPNHKDLVLIQQKCTACFVAAAKATGCETTFHFEETPYYPMEPNTTMAAIYKEQAQNLGIQFSEAYNVLETHIGSTDFGNVSQVVPCIMPAYDIGKQSYIHSVEFHESAGSQEAADNTMQAAKAMTMTAAVILASPPILESIRAEHQEQHGRGAAASRQRMMSQASEQGD